MISLFCVLRQEKLALAYNNRGFLYYLKVEFELAVQDYTQALRHNDSLAVAFYNRGLVHYRMSKSTYWLYGVRRTCQDGK